MVCVFSKTIKPNLEAEGLEGSVKTLSLGRERERQIDTPVKRTTVQDGTHTRQKERENEYSATVLPQPRYTHTHTFICGIQGLSIGII